MQPDTAREAQEAGLPVEAAGLSVQVVMGKVGLPVQTWGLPLALQNLMNRSPHKKHIQVAYLVLRQLLLSPWLVAYGLSSVLPQAPHCTRAVLPALTQLVGPHRQPGHRGQRARSITCGNEENG